MIGKRFVTYVFSGNLGFSPRKINCSLGEVLFSSRELGFFPKENSLFSREIVFCTKELFLLNEELAWD
jgi:hypothetical protein